jgi:DNA-binding MarR family transcriptional regulator
MDDVARVRRFTRLVTQRVGVLTDRYLARDRPLGESRLLWEIDTWGGTGADVRALRSRLDLDSGYLSRLLRGLEREGLVTVSPSVADRRMRIARLTAAGRAERATLDERADEAAASLLAPLPASRRARLLAAMDEVDRLLTAAAVAFEVVDPDSPDARACLSAYYEEIDRRFDGGFDPANGIPADGDQIRPPNGLLVLARLRDRPVGCGVLRCHPPAAQIKRMWIADEVRGLGLGRRLLAELESHALRTGHGTVRLETNKALPEAVAMYRGAGYTEVPPFNDETYAHHWFEKRLET